MRKDPYGLQPPGTKFVKRDETEPLYADTNIREALLFCSKFIEMVCVKWGRSWKQRTPDGRPQPDRVYLAKRNGIDVLVVSDGVRAEESKIAPGMYPFLSALVETLPLFHIITIQYAYTSLFDAAVKHYKERHKND